MHIFLINGLVFLPERFWCGFSSIEEILPPFTILRMKKADFKFLYSLNYNDKILQEKFPEKKWLKDRIIRKRVE